MSIEKNNSLPENIQKYRDILSAISNIYQKNITILDEFTKWISQESKWALAQILSTHSPIIDPSTTNEEIVIEVLDWMNVVSISRVDMEQIAENYNTFKNRPAGVVQQMWNVINKIFSSVGVKLQKWEKASIVK